MLSCSWSCTSRSIKWWPCMSDIDSESLARGWGGLYFQRCVGQPSKRAFLFARHVDQVRQVESWLSVPLMTLHMMCVLWFCR
jgi:hypothetical protein